MASNHRTPPRFVPTLTTVLDMPGEPHSLPLPLLSEAEALQALSAGKRQLAFVNVLVGGSVAAAADGASAADAAASRSAKAGTGFPEETAAPGLLASESQFAIDVHALSDADAFSLEEQMMHRVLQRIDLSLEERLSDAVSAAVQQQLDAMVPHLRNEIEGVLRSLVVEALSKELSDNTGSVPASSPQSVG